MLLLPYVSNKDVVKLFSLDNAYQQMFVDTPYIINSKVSVNNDEESWIKCNVRVRIQSLKWSTTRCIGSIMHGSHRFDSITRLYTKYKTQQISKVIRRNLPALQHLLINNAYNASIYDLPRQLLSIKFGIDYNQAFTKSSFPRSLTEIKFHQESSFNVPILPNVLPPKLRRLYFGNRFNQSLRAGILPLSLALLRLGTDFESRLEVRHLMNLKALALDDAWATPSVNPVDLPRNLIYYEMNNSRSEELSGVFPEDLKIIRFGRLYNHELTRSLFHYNLESLTTIQFGQRFNSQLKPNVLPHSLLYLFFGKDYNHEFTKEVLPKQLKVLYLGVNYHQFFKPGILPTSLEFFHLPDVLLAPFEYGSLPASMHTLMIDCYVVTEMQGEFEKVLPVSLTHLILLKHEEPYTQYELNVKALPPNLVSISISTKHSTVDYPDHVVKMNKLAFDYEKALQISEDES